MYQVYCNRLMAVIHPTLLVISIPNACSQRLLSACTLPIPFFRYIPMLGWVLVEKGYDLFREYPEWVFRALYNS